MPNLFGSIFPFMGCCEDLGVGQLTIRPFIRTWPRNALRVAKLSLLVLFLASAGTVSAYAESMFRIEQPFGKAFSYHFANENKTADKKRPLVDHLSHLQCRHRTA